MKIRKKKNWFLKGLALFFAFLLWFFVVLQDKIERELPLELHFVSLPPNTLVLQVKPSQCRLRVLGPRSIMRALSEEALVAEIDLSRYTPGRHLIRLNPEAISLPSGLKALEVIPPEIEIFLDALSQKWVKVKADLKEFLEPNQVQEIRIAPPSVKIKGARSVLKSIRWIYTQPITLEPQGNFWSGEVPLAVPEGVIEVRPSKVKVQVRLKKGGAE